jgi:hypothetical protein
MMARTHRGTAGRAGGRTKNAAQLRFEPATSTLL